MKEFQLQDLNGHAEQTTVGGYKTVGTVNLPANSRIIVTKNLKADAQDWNAFSARIEVPNSNTPVFCHIKRSLMDALGQSDLVTKTIQLVVNAPTIKVGELDEASCEEYGKPVGFKKAIFSLDEDTVPFATTEPRSTASSIHMEFINRIAKQSVEAPV